MTATLSFGALLKQLRKRAGMTQRDLAAALNYSDSFISSLENAQRQPDLSAVIAHFIPALGLHDDPTTAAHLIERAAAARGERLPDPVTLYHLTHSGSQEEQNRHPSALPTPPDELIGRDEEVHRLCNRLRGHGGRLLTLVGPPGIGKTRLALAVAARLQRHYPDGALFVPLAAVTDPTVMASTIALAVGGDDTSAKSPTVRLIETLRRKRLLLLLDNCEQIVGAAPLIADMLAACPGLYILATSRERLHLRAEQRYRVPALDIASAIELFAQRAAAVEADFTITAANRPTIEAICWRLDRLPLALELCAAQVDLLSPAQLLTYLHARPLDLLVDGAHDLPPQHRTLRDAIQRSYKLLSEDERTLFRRMGVFVGGCDLEALEAVSGWQEATHPRSLLSTLHALLGKSLVRTETMPRGEQRFTMLETIHEYALERLETSGDAAALRRRHAEYYLALAEGMESKLRTADQLLWLGRQEEDHNNFRAALTWSRAATDAAEVGLRLAGALGQFWEIRGYTREGREWLEKALARSSLVGGSVRAKALSAAGVLAYQQGDLSSVVTLNEESYELYLKLGDKAGIATSLVSLGDVARHQDDYIRAEAWYQESLSLYRGLNDRYGIAEALSMLGALARYQGDYAREEMYALESLALRRTLGDRQSIAWSLSGLGSIAQRQGDYTRAAAWYRESLVLCRELGYQHGIASMLVRFAELAVDYGRPDRAVRLWSAAAVLREAIGVPIDAGARPAYEPAVAATMPQLDDATFAAAWAEGQAMTVEQAISYALEESDREGVSLRADER